MVAVLIYFCLSLFSHKNDLLTFGSSEFAKTKQKNIWKRVFKKLGEDSHPVYRYVASWPLAVKEWKVKTQANLNLGSFISDCDHRFTALTIALSFWGWKWFRNQGKTKIDIKYTKIGISFHSKIYEFCKSTKQNKNPVNVAFL